MEVIDESHARHFFCTPGLWHDFIFLNTVFGNISLETLPNMRRYQQSKILEAWKPFKSETRFANFGLEKIKVGTNDLRISVSC